MCCLVFLVLTNLPSIAAVLVMNGVFVFQAGYDCLQLRWCGNGRKRKHFEDSGEYAPAASSSTSCGSYVDRMMTAILENKFTRFAALILQLGALIGMAVYIGWLDHSSEGLSLAITLPVCLLTLSAVWCTKVQQWKNECTIIANRAASANIIRVSAVDRPTARYKSSKSYTCTMPDSTARRHALLAGPAVNKRVQFWGSRLTASYNYSYMGYFTLRR